MKKEFLPVRKNWQKWCEELGFTFHTDELGAYWQDGACYVFSEAEIEVFERMTLELHQMCLEAVDFVITHNRFYELGINEPFAQLCRRSWQKKEQGIYGRFDFSYDDKSPPKLLEYNADTPTSLLEAAVVQWVFLEDRFPEDDQFNRIHEALIEQLQTLPCKTLYCACARESHEDLCTTEYIHDLALQAGLDCKFIYVDDIGWDGVNFVDLQNKPIKQLFKLYPWEWMFEEEFAPYLLSEPWQVIEPSWKVLLSSKGILPILWELFPEHPNLLPSFFNPKQIQGKIVRKPCFSREGENITIEHLGLKTEGSYDDCSNWIYQQFAPLPNFYGRYPVIGSWVIGDEAAGISIREDESLITLNSSHFVPHRIDL
ncbi:glutathionylspermidine synthase family protein [Synechococcales cyanobacterium C]|uniref:Glutathionylspermidine synthase family protein n=1 Tax=Petrachloros mirabilis ULC683 TaxID=2781853 RepID=A0A8K2A7J3_9CYAN|nr:glutathionylspermidine synthase family protein [Petrachloros mirabilis]NCJ06145.1 glutathionylspermidine synthase family protein [Petrachloros mirabilis ULC683]